MKQALIIISLTVLVAWLACQQPQKVSQPDTVKQYYLQTIRATDSAVAALVNAIGNKRAVTVLQSLFLQARLAYKRAEVFAEYYTPLTARYINGAPIPSMDENDQHKIDYPEGFQVIEPYLFLVPDTLQIAGLLIQSKILAANVHRLQMMAEQQAFANEQVFDALRLEAFRIITLGITGFDAPIAQRSIPEAAAALGTLKEVIAVYKDSLQQKDVVLYTQLQALLDKSVQYLNARPDFNRFNRLEFITAYANPLGASLLKAARVMGNQPFKELRALKADAATLFDKEAFDPDYYTASYAAHSNKEKELLGSYLFFDPVLSGTGKRSCATCHQPGKAFTDGLVQSTSIDGKGHVRRNTPTILNAGLQPSLFYDMRVAYLEDQATDVITNKDEMHGSLSDAISRLQQSEEYKMLFQQAFPKDTTPLTACNLRNAIGSYIRSLSSLNAPFDQYVRGNKAALNQQQVNGFNVFAGKAKCATCHFMPLFNGTVPPNFATIESEVIGVPLAGKKDKVDTDAGRYALRHLLLFKNAFRTPTVRNIALTAPYMHNGVYNRLEEVIDFYNDGGATGLGIELENQTLPFDRLQLTVQEKKDLVAFMQSLTDTAAATRIPQQLPSLKRNEPRRSLSIY